jgi:hypothetical protein
MPGAVRVLVTDPLEEMAGRVVYSQQLLTEKGVLSNGGGLGVDQRRRVSGFALTPGT